MSDRDEPALESLADSLATGSESVMDMLELVTALVLVFLFAVGVFDLGLKLAGMIQSGAITSARSVIKLIDTVLLLLIIVEIYRTVIAYVEDKEILPIVVNVGMIAMARKIISFRTGKYESASEALLGGLTYGLLLLFLVAAFAIIHYVDWAVDGGTHGDDDRESRGGDAGGASRSSGGGSGGGSAGRGGDGSGAGGSAGSGN
ncbi:phosphate-starvation-inducible PsiE family protein [Halobaculum sp. D14]|uniref:phosphate-starvation-inducible PsiE family protein n=1 Tax=unclassified Halobaculum TaxID=2640896 RepID=UPI003EB9CBE2